MNHATRVSRPAKAQRPALRPVPAGPTTNTANLERTRDALNQAALNASNQQALLTLQSWIEGARSVVQEATLLHDRDPGVAEAFRSWGIDPHKAVWGSEESDALKTLLAMLWEQHRAQQELTIAALQTA